jgi:hypothetical protein
MLTTMEKRGTVFSGGPWQEVIIGKICWTGVLFSSVCEETAFLNDI